MVLFRHRDAVDKVLIKNNVVLGEEDVASTKFSLLDE